MSYIMESYNTSASVTANLIDGQWVINDEQFADLDITDLIITDEMMEELASASGSEGLVVRYYYDSDLNLYIIEQIVTYTDADTGEVATYKTQIYLNQYFYMTAQYMSYNGMLECIDVDWRAQLTF